MHYLAALLDMTQPAVADALTGSLSVSGGKGKGGAGGKWGAAPALPTASSVWPACHALSCARDEVHALPADLSALSSEVSRYGRLARVPLPITLAQGGKPSMEAQASPAQVLAVISTQLQELQTQYASLLVEVSSVLPGLCPQDTPSPPLACALLDLCTALGKARQDMKAHAEAQGLQA
jgi:hypothetical protein